MSRHSLSDDMLGALSGQVRKPRTAWLREVPPAFA